MPGNPFYSSRQWRALCAAVHRRSRGMCEAPGCTERAKVVDHVVSRRAGGPDVLANLRHLCRAHDNAVKEDKSGARRSRGKLVVKGCFPDGSPRDPSHPWFTGGGGRSNISAPGAATGAGHGNRISKG
jgi:5-methylcytosine-specific restriction endonuclease McrA